MVERPSLRQEINQKCLMLHIRERVVVLLLCDDGEPSDEYIRPCFHYISVRLVGYLGITGRALQNSLHIASVVEFVKE